MITNCEPIKRKIQIILISINLIFFIIISIYVNNNKDYIEYTHLPKFFPNFYVTIILIIMLIHSISSNLICIFISENLSILTNSKGKIIILLLIGILFWTSNNNFHVLFGVVNFISVFILVLCEFIFDCKIVKKINIDSDNNNEIRETNLNDNSNTNNINNHLMMNQQISQKQRRNESNVPFFENIQNNDNYFDNIKQVNIKAQNSIK